jgi:hypothetical protein
VKTTNRWLAALALPLALAGLARAQETQELSLEDVAARVRACYERADVEAAKALLTARPDLRTHDRASELVSIKVTFEPREEWGVAITVTRRIGVEGPVGVVFPPGSLASPERTSMRRDGGDDGPDSQELCLLRAPVMVLAADQVSASLWVPAVCGDHDLPAPTAGKAHFMTYVKPGSAADKVAVQLCAGAAPSPEAQALVWITRNDSGRDEAGVNDEAEVTRVLGAAGVQTGTLRFFNESPGTRGRVRGREVW